MHFQMPFMRRSRFCVSKAMTWWGGGVEAGKKKYLSALRLLPEDPREWEAATWIYVAIGDVHFQMEDYDKAFKCFYNAVQCPKGLGNPYIHLRLGQLYYEQENFDKATDELARAYMGGGIDIFMEDDPKYLVGPEQSAKAYRTRRSS
ncbi:tetratricopeptide repeat protein [Ralstonia syzygii subsp. celebesensis]|uniref:tetratricopeptide repeat protein n=1 Tax=Ralstonia syzygii TaxID=28097 RepID=UPI00191E56F1|nr:tetratricopeptide repeat protein [Ralstonia syzygii]QQV55049.1 tetratricopeptide repeat protein [Ralstonia syzygii subsp. celebesensis]